MGVVSRLDSLEILAFGFGLPKDDFGRELFEFCNLGICNLKRRFAFLVILVKKLVL